MECLIRCGILRKRERVGVCGCKQLDERDNENPFFIVLSRALTRARAHFEDSIACNMENGFDFHLTYEWESSNYGISGITQLFIINCCR